MGERVLAFSRMRLDENQFPRDFDFNVKSEQENFPLNDPPRDGVRRSVETCK